METINEVGGSVTRDNLMAAEEEFAEQFTDHKGRRLIALPKQGQAPALSGPALFAQNRYRGINTSSDAFRPHRPAPIPLT